ncbi:uncharacterized protein METZ01_LOCUS53561 [marine metagenome]|uniref:Uncharacterized protein n=1 Tax=marine metagenome TaxID=408172 RepID=A0A381SEH2_9ZZZZ
MTESGNRTEAGQPVTGMVEALDLAP